MYPEKDDAPAFEKFYLPFDRRLHGDNRWVKMNDLIPWDEVEERYRSCFKKKKGRKAKNVRLAFGALIIKEKLKLTDEETVEQIRENHYLQFFLGFEGYRYERPFEASMMTYFRRRLGPEVIAEINEIIARKFHEEQEIQAKQESVARKEKHDDDRHDDDQGNHGQLLLDATCAPQDMRHPSDVLLLNESREKTEHIIDVLHDTTPGTDKPRTYRKVARKEFLIFMHSRKRTKRMVRRALRKQIAFVKRNLASIDDMRKGIRANPLSARLERDLEVVREILRQQTYLYKNNTHAIPGKILSISQPHVRAIARGKARGNFEFGAKISAAVAPHRMVYIDRLSWEPYNESEDLIPQVEKYRGRFGHYPESVHADKIYRTRANLQYCAERDIRLSGPKLGRPFKNTENNAARIRALKKIMREDESIRQEVESVFGVGKRRYGLDRIMARTRRTSESMIMLSVLVMNLETILRDLLFVLFGLRWNRAVQSVQFAIQGFRQSVDHRFIGEYSGNMAFITV